MPNIGGVFIPDNLMPTVHVPEAERPGVGTVFSAAAAGAYGQLRYGLPYAAAKLGGGMTAQDEQYYQQNLARTEAAAAQAAPAGLDDLTGGKVGIGRFITENLAASLPYMGASLVGAAAGGAVAGPVGALVGGVAAGVPQFTGSNVARAVDETGTLSEGAAFRSVAAAIPQAASDVLVERYLPGAGHVFGDLAATQAGGFLRRTATSIAKAGATEAVTEAGQQVAERYAAGQPLGTPDAAAEYVNAAVTAFAVGGALGAGGGFRRTAAHAKPADQVTNEDLSQNIDGMLDGSLRALPAPADFHVGADGVSRINPSGRTQLALPSPDQFREPDFVADSEGRIVPPGFEGEQAIAIDRNLPQPSAPPAPTVEDILARFGQTQIGLPSPEMFGRSAQGPQIEAQPQAAVTDAAGRTVMPGELFGSDVGGKEPTLAIGGDPTAPQILANLPRGDPNAPAVRLFADKPIADINTTLRNQDAPPAVREAANHELESRRLEAIGEAPLTTDNYQSRVDDLKTGLKGGWVQKLAAADPKELVDKTYDEIFENQNTAANVQKFAQRVGLLDEKGAATPMAEQITVQRTAALQAEAAAPPIAPLAPTIASTATPDPEFSPKWEQTKRDAGVSRNAAGMQELKALGAPVNQADAEEKVFRALATDKSNVEVSQVEKLARHLGLVTNDGSMDITPQGRQVFLRTPEGRTAIAEAAGEHAYAGAQQSLFEQGVASATSDQAAPAVTNVDDKAAFEAGRVWAKDFVATPTTKTAAQSDAIRARIVANDKRKGVKFEPRKTTERAPLSTAQVQQAALNRVIDAADLRSVNDSDVAALRKLVRDGASTQEVGEALQRVQGGQTLFKEAERTAEIPVGERPGRRGQPVFKEMNTPDARANRTANRTETEAAVKAYGVRNLIEFAKTEGGITEARARKLHDLLDQGKVDQVKKSLKDFDPDVDAKAAGEASPLQERKLYTGGADAAFEAAIAGKDADGVLDHMIQNAPSAYHRELMSKVKTAMDSLRKVGVAVDVRVVRPGDVVPRELNNPTLRAYTVSLRNPPKSTVYLKSTALGGTSGTNYQMAAHEMLHAVTMRLVNYGKQNPDTKIGKDVKDLIDLSNTIIRHFNQRANAGNLNDFEQAYFNRQHNAFADSDEILAWGMTNPDMQRYLQSIEYKPRQSVFSRMVDLVRGLLGLDGKYDTALTELIRVSEQIMQPNQNDLTSTFVVNNPEGMATEPLAAAAAETASVDDRTPATANDVTQKVTEIAAKTLDTIASTGFGAKMRRLVLGGLTLNHIVRQYGHIMPGLEKLQDAKRSQGAVRGRFENMGHEAFQSFERLTREDKPNAERLSKLMALTTEFQVDPDKPWDAHEHLTGKPNEARLKALHNDAVKLKNDLSRGDGAGIKLFNDMRQLNEAQNIARMAAGLHSLVSMDPELKLGVQGAAVNPVDTFMTQAGLVTPAQIRTFWNKALADQVTAAQAFIAEKKGEVVGGTVKEREAMGQHLSPIEMQIAAIFEAQKGMARSPYFHLGRYGDYFGSANMRANADGTVDPKARQVVSDALEKAGFTGIQMSADNTRARFSLRFENAQQATQFGKLMLDLQRQGHLSSDKIQAGPRSRENNYGAADGLPSYVQRYIQSLETSPSFTPAEDATPAERAALAKRKEDTIRLAVDTWMETQPDTSISKVLAKRYAVPGYDADMSRNFAHRWHVGSINIANVATLPKYNDAYNDMRAATNEALDVSNDSDPELAADLMSEVKKRDATNPVNELADTFDKARGWAHAYFLGLSPAYGMINMTQLGVTALPELAKQHGYAKSFHAMRRATSVSMAIIKAATGEAVALGPKHAADLTITESVLAKAGLDARTSDFVRRMIATGSIDIGTSARALGQISETGGSSKTETALKYAGAIGLYTETFSRLVTALAAHDLHGGAVADSSKYATDVVSNSMFDYQNWNTARQFGKQGFAGPVTPLLTQFMSYSLQVTEKLYSEVHSAIGKPRPGESVESAKARATESRRYLMGHLTAVTTLAGTLGLPFASVFASAIERLVDAFDDDDDPYDATASWRGFLADVLGKDVAEVVARGLPRAVGFDISARAGEQGLLPFTDLLTDRRPWKDALADSAGRSGGAALSMATNIITGGGKIADGDLIGGMKDMMPVALKGPSEVYRMSNEGYVDTKGNKLPMTPGASAILWQLLGFTPSQKAEYSEARGDQAARKGEIGRAAGVLRNQIVKAMLPGGDPERARELVTRAIKFDQDNPAFAVVPSLKGALERQVKAQAQASVVKAPSGVAIDDLAGQRLTSYANVDYGR